jgi:hypothetical protein
VIVVKSQEDEMHALIVLSVCLAIDGMEPLGVITGVAVNGTAGGVPLAGCQIVLRASQNGSFEPIAETTTDSNGRFSFTDLPLDEKVIYLPGANRHDVHYPGARVRLHPNRQTANVNLTAFDAIESPCPLVMRRHDIEIRPGTEFIAVAETLVIDNRTLTAYVGQATDDRPAVTLRLSLPDTLEQITFEREFHGRNFQLQEKMLSTDIPWRPGTQELKFMYRLPTDPKHPLFLRQLELPTDHVVIRVVTSDTSRPACNIPRINGNDQNTATYEYRDSEHPLPPGYTIELRLGEMPLGFADYARSTATLLLCALILGTVMFTYRRRALKTRRYDIQDQRTPPLRALRGAPQAKPHTAALPKSRRGSASTRK